MTPKPLNPVIFELKLLGNKIPRNGSQSLGDRIEVVISQCR